MVFDRFLPKKGSISKNRDTLSSSTLPVPPEEVLFRRKGAPERFEENDLYWADRHLTSDQILPDSDLLKAVHTYASDFYGRVTVDKGLGDFQSMDETALLTLGILLEESAKESLGEDGDLVFVEGEDDEEGKLLNEFEAIRGSSDQTFGAMTVMRSSSQAGGRSEEGKSRKRRKLNENATDAVS